MRLLTLLLTLAVLLFACSDDATSDDNQDASALDGTSADADAAVDTLADAAEDTNLAGTDTRSIDTASACQPTDYDAKIVTFCRQQNPSPPAAGDFGADCTEDSQCDSNLCLNRVDSHCTVACPNGDECPNGYLCEDVGEAEPACVWDFCDYGGYDASSCVDNTAQQARNACNFNDCGQRFETWLDCLIASSMVCHVPDAENACGIERGLLESCCIGCDSDYW